MNRKKQLSNGLSYDHSRANSHSMEGALMEEGVVQFEAEIRSLKEIRSRVIWPDSEGPWIEGGLDDMTVHFAYACWTAYNMRCMMSLSLASQDRDLGQAISNLMTRMVSTLGAIQMAEIHLTPDALNEIRRNRVQP